MSCSIKEQMLSEGTNSEQIAQIVMLSINY